MVINQKKEAIISSPVRTNNTNSNSYEYSTTTASSTQQSTEYQLGTAIIPTTLPNDSLSRSIKSSKKGPVEKKEVPVVNDQISLLTNHLLKGDDWFKYLEGAGWQVSKDGNFAMGPSGEFFEDINKPFTSFQSHLKKDGFIYNEDSQIIVKGTSVATFEQISASLKDYLGIVDPTSDPVLLFKSYLHLDVFFALYEEKGWTIDYSAKTFSSLQGNSVTYTALEAGIFLPKQKQLLEHLKNQGFSYNMDTRMLSKGTNLANGYDIFNLTLSFLQADNPDSVSLTHSNVNNQNEFSISNNDPLDHLALEEIRSTLHQMMYFDKYVEMCKSKGVKIHADGFVTSPDNRVFPYSKLQDEWTEIHQNLINWMGSLGVTYDKTTDLLTKGNVICKPDIAFDECKIAILKKLAEKGWEYDPDNKCFIDSSNKQLPLMHAVIREFMNK